MTFGIVFTAILPVFFFALSQNEGTLRFSKPLRLVALVAALGISLRILVLSPGLMESLGRVGPTSVLTPERGRLSLGDISALAGELASASLVWLLAAMFRQKQDETEAPVPVSKLLRITTKIAVIAYGLAVAINIFRVALSPYIYTQARTVLQRSGRALPPFRFLVESILGDLLTYLCLFIAPFVIWNAIRDARGHPHLLQDQDPS